MLSPKPQEFWEAVWASKKFAWTPPGPRGMSMKDREKYIPNEYVRKWTEGNEEMMLHSLKRFKSLKIRVLFQLEEHKDDEARRLNRNRNGGPNPKKWTTIRGKTIQIRKIPNQGMAFQLIKAMQDAALEISKK